MKRVGPFLSLMQQAVLALTMGTIASLFWFLQASLRTHVHRSLSLSAILYFAIGVAIFMASIWISYDLRTGIESERWPEIEIDRFRATFDKPWLTGTTVALALIAIFFMFFVLASSRLHHLPGAGYGLLSLSQTLSQFSMAVRRPRPRATGPHIDWRNVPPVTSDHWGQRN